METRFRSSSIRVAIVLVMMMATALATGCGVSKSKYLEATKQSEQLQASLDQANKDKSQLQSQNATLDDQVKQMQATNQQLQSKLQEQQASTTDVKSSYESMISQLQTEVNSGKVEVQQMRDGISVNLAQDILFPSGSAELDKEGRDILLKVADNLKTSTLQVVVTGHTDNHKIGSTLMKRYPTNWELGGARASRIVRLFEEAGIAKERLAAVSFADSRPRESNDTPEGRTKNRRIEIKLRPAATDQTAGN